MMKNSYFKSVGFLSLFTVLLSIFSCSENGYDDPISDAPGIEEDLWYLHTSISLQLAEDAEPFTFATDPGTGNKAWDYAMTSLTGSLQTILPIAQFEKIDFYVTVVEENGLNFSNYNKQGRYLKSVTDLAEDGSFTLDLNADEIYALYEDDFQNERLNFPALPGDIFDLRWVIQRNDGSVYDSREYTTIDSQFGLKVNSYLLTPAVWAGDYSWELVAASALAESFGLGVGLSGTTTFTETRRGSQAYTVPDISFAGGDPNGQITYDYESGLTSVTSSTYQTTWNIVKVDGATMEIEVRIGYYYDLLGWDISWTVLLTRTDGEDWPEEPHTPKSE